MNNNNVILFAKNKQMSCRHLCPRCVGIDIAVGTPDICLFLVLPAVDNEVFRALVIYVHIIKLKFIRFFMHFVAAAPSVLYHYYFIVPIAL